MKPLLRLLSCLTFLMLAACGDTPWNDPYPASAENRDILYSAFITRPKHLDPAKSYTEDEYTFITQIYEPPLQYHYLKRPYVLVPAALARMPEVTLYDAEGRRLPADAPAEKVAESVYELRLAPGRLYQPHPAFALDAAGAPVYAEMTPAELAKKYVIADFPLTGAREVRAADYIYQIKRLAHPRLHSPIFGMMAEKIVGLRELGAALSAAAKEDPEGWLDLDDFPLAGVREIDPYTWQIRITGRYPQFLYWLAQPFFSPLPREADRFFSQPGMAEKNLTLDWWPVGSGPYMLTENDPNRRMTLTRNPNFRGETYPCEGMPEDEEEGHLADCGQPLPFIEEAIFTREKEAIPYWNKFLQGYYDASGIGSDNFDQVVRIDAAGEAGLTDEMRERGIRLLAAARSSTFYMGFNLRDPLVGGMEEAASKLRRAISIAIDQEEFISIFMNGRGLPAMSPLPPGLFGFEEGEAGINPYVYDWVDGRARRKSVQEARRLIAEAGWPNGRHARTGEPLILYLDTTSGGMGDKPRLDWLTRQFRKIDIQLVVRATDFNRLQDNLKKGTVQLFFLGWNADYPDPENFFFLLAGSEGKVKYGGENHSNYENPEFDRLFLRMKAMENSPERLAIIREMKRILQHDAPWIYAFHPQTYTLTHAWLRNRKLSDAANNTLKYQRILPEDRARARRDWNPPLRWPLFLIVAACGVFFWAIVRLYRKRNAGRGIARP
ncbi:MAG: ABC transporter substrate-binding protein [Zoogloeaceae bacterium]|jgi:ABC-type transport system substrate-binding protein|nr:ABC transporter substrate-binding protein [Zoogloeaceae bacterium]